MVINIVAPANDMFDTESKIFCFTFMLDEWIHKLIEQYYIKLTLKFINISSHFFVNLHLKRS